MSRVLKPLRPITLALVLLLASCEERAIPAATPIPSVQPPAEAKMGEASPFTVLGVILPAQRLRLSFSVSGPVHAVRVAVGQEVNAGDLLAELQTADLEAAVSEARDGLAIQEALLGRTRTGAHEQEVAIAEAEYERALAQHEGLLAGPRGEEVAAAQAEHQAALARYEQVKTGAGEQDLIAAQAAWEKAQIALKRAQAAYDLVAGRPGVGASPQAAALHEATVDCRAAEAQYQRLKSLPSQAELLEARARVAFTQAQVALAQAGPTEQEVRASAASLKIAESRLALVRAGPLPEDVAVAEAQLQQARTTLNRAELALSKAQVVAPFDATVSALYLQPGEWAAAGVPILELLDTSRWRVETRTVGELKIGRVRVGQEAAVRVIALGDAGLIGRVTAISPVAVVQQGDTTYTVFIDVKPTGLNLRPGMNVEVQILTD